MTLRVLFAGALTALPLLISGALAQDLASPPAVTISPAPSASPPARDELRRAACADSRESACPNRRFSAAVQSGGPIDPGPRARKSFHASGGIAADGGNRAAPGAVPSTAAPIPSAQAAAPKPKKVAPPAPPRETALSDDPRPTLQPDTFFATAKASERYSAIVDAGGWPTDIAAIGPGTKGPAVAKLRKRLAIEGDLTGGEASGLAWDNGLTAGVKRFQARMGLRQTGIVSGATLKAINIPARVRFNQLASSANRLAGLNFSFDDRYVVVNLPSTSVEAVENGRIAHRYVAIVGGPEHPSPEISAHIQAVNLNPTWTVPTSIIKKEIIPRMQRDPGYLTRAKIRILDNSGKEINPKSVDWSTRTGGQLYAAARFGRRAIRSARSASTCPTSSPSTCTTRLRKGCSAPTIGSSATAASGCRASTITRLGCWKEPAGGWDKAAMEAKIKEGAPYRHQPHQGGAGDLGVSDRLVERRRVPPISATTSITSTMSAKRRSARRRRRSGKPVSGVSGGIAATSRTNSAIASRL